MKAEEIIRCKDCIHRPVGDPDEHDVEPSIENDYKCPCLCEGDNWYSWIPADDWFCANGETRMKAEWTNRDSLSIEETTGQNSKSIVVIDTPKNCRLCPLRESPWSFCLGEYEKHCPLRPLPEPKDLGYPNDDYDIGFADGWNACLEELEKWKP